MKINRYLVNGFTLIEVVVTLAIIVIVFSIAAARTNRLGSRSNINLTTEALVSNLRSTAMSALNSEQFQLNNTYGWGVRVESDSGNGIYDYIVFADLNNNLTYDSNEKFKSVVLDKDVKINFVGTGDGNFVANGSIFFTSLTAKPYFETREINDINRYIEIELEDKINGEKKHVFINPFGAVDSD